MSTIVTPPDLIDSPIDYLIINAKVTDIEMVISWLKIKERHRIIYLYKEQMKNHDWLKMVSSCSKKILVERHNTATEDLKPLFDSLAKIVWFGEDQEYRTATEYLIKND